MNDIRRTVLWVVFTMSLFLLWDAWNKHIGQPSLFSPVTPSATAPKSPSGASAVVSDAASTAGVPAAATPGSATSAVPNGAATATPGAAVAASEVVTVTTDTVRAQFDSRGAQLIKLELLKHADHNTADGPVVLFDRSTDRIYLAQTGLIATQAGLTLPNHLSPMKVIDGPRALAEGQNALTLRFESAEPGGVQLIKSFTFERGSYTVGVKHEVKNDTAAAVSPSLYLQLARDGNAPKGESSMYFTFTGPAMYTDVGKFRKVEFKDIEKGKAEHEKAASDGWISMVQHYFTSVWLMPPGQKREYRTAKVSNNLYSIAMVTELGEIAPGASKSFEASLYAGPQEENKLAAMAPGLELVKDYGWFRILASPLFWVLDQLNGFFGNWGWAIVGLVVLLKLAFYSLNAHAYRSMGKMKALSPRVNEMRDRYKDKPQQMQQEMMRLYKEEKVNPLGGCLPIFAQMPFFIALYWVLLSSAEMRNAPWIGWITDLSAKDPYYILPVLMTASSLLQVAIGTKPPDPMQARMMWMMPLAFGVMFFFFPAGLVLYWLTNNILSIAQQWYINKKLGVAQIS